MLQYIISNSHLYTNSHKITFKIYFYEEKSPRRQTCLRSMKMLMQSYLKCDVGKKKKNVMQVIVFSPGDPSELAEKGNSSLLCYLSAWLLVDGCGEVGGQVEWWTYLFRVYQAYFSQTNIDTYHHRNIGIWKDTVERNVGE